MELEAIIFGLECRGAEDWTGKREERRKQREREMDTWIDGWIEF